jgi:hypothetical protein
MTQSVCTIMLGSVERHRPDILAMGYYASGIVPQITVQQVSNVEVH